MKIKFKNSYDFNKDVKERSWTLGMNKDLNIYL